MIIIVMISRKLRGKSKIKIEDQAEEATEYEDLNA